MRCPRDYQFRKVFGFSPAIPDLFGFGMTVHTAVGKLHERFPESPPSTAEAREIAEDTFHLKHIKASNDPVERPGPYERAKERAAQLVENYAESFSDDFRERRQIEARFDIPVQDAVVSGAIDLMIEEDEDGNVVDACVIDFKTLEGGEQPLENTQLEWTELALQVQLYARAARDVLDKAIEQGHVHLLKDNQRIEVPVDDAAVAAAIQNVEWTVSRIVANDFPMRPHKDKCPTCDFRQICNMSPQNFSVKNRPPRIQVPGVRRGREMAAFELFDPNFSAN
jgi:DNA helicase-2/ATP-dependent DNA helicase PcrA